MQKPISLILTGIMVVLLLALPGCGGGGSTSNGYYNDSGTQVSATTSQVTNVTNLNNPGEPIRQGDWCQITGSGFGASQTGASSNGYVLFGFQSGTEGQADSYQQWSDTQITCRVPTNVKRSSVAREAMTVKVVKPDTQNLSNAAGSTQVTYNPTPNPSPDVTPPTPTTTPTPSPTTPAPSPSPTTPTPTATTPTPTQTSGGGGGGGGGGPTTGSIAVTVNDTNGDAVADAVLTYSKVKAFQAKADEFKTNAEGKCTIGNLAPGTYNVTATKIGYTTTESDDVDVTASNTPVEKTITVTPAVLASIAVTPAESSVQNGSDKQFIATGTLTDGTTQVITTTVTWNSSDVTKATISNTDGSRGLAHSVGVGTTKITAQSGLITSPEVTLTVIPAEGALKWTGVGGNCLGASNAAIGTDGTIYIGTEVDNLLHAINPLDGSDKWTFNAGAYIESSPAIGNDGTVYFCANNNNLYALNPTTGLLKWDSPYSNGGTRSPAIGNDGYVYVSGADCKVCAINPASNPPGLVWSCAIHDGWMTTGPVIASDGTVYVRTNYSDLIAVKYSSALGAATEKWSVNMDSNGGGAPAIAGDGTIYVHTSSKLYSTKPDGSVNWIYDNVEGNGGPVIGIDGTVYVGSGDYLCAITPGATAGTEKWKYYAGNTSGAGVTPTAVASDGRIYITAGWSVQAVSSDGNLLWKTNLGNNDARGLVIGSDGTIYAGNAAGGFFALYGSFTLADTPWPMFNRDVRHTGRQY